METINLRELYDDYVGTDIELSVCYSDETSKVPLFVLGYDRSRNCEEFFYQNKTVSEKLKKQEIKDFWRLVTQAPQPRNITDTPKGLNVDTVGVVEFEFEGAKSLEPLYATYRLNKGNV